MCARFAPPKSALLPAIAEGVRDTLARLPPPGPHDQFCRTRRTQLATHLTRALDPTHFADPLSRTLGCNPRAQPLGPTHWRRTPGLNPWRRTLGACARPTQAPAISFYPARAARRLTRRPLTKPFH